MHSLDLVEVHRFLAAQLPRTPHLKHHFKRHFRQSAYISPWRSENAATFLFSPRSLAKNYSKTLLSWVHRKKAQLPIVLVPEIRHGNDYAFTVSLQHGCPTATQHWSTQVRRWRSSKHQSFFTIATPVEELARRKPHRSRPKISRSKIKRAMNKGHKSKLWHMFLHRQRFWNQSSRQQGSYLLHVMYISCQMISIADCRRHQIRYLFVHPTTTTRRDRRFSYLWNIIIIT